ncbi:unnamed protein product [Trifolium pratense]|uniref:Uncharacterized protein n=1 Tax=Trifolium pratense TaxID=57577 RepID=A0ACB0IS68_TRIPR|nr:unnamed protein product [Trifolium pratense]
MESYTVINIFGKSISQRWKQNFVHVKVRHGQGLVLEAWKQIYVILMVLGALYFELVLDSKGALASLSQNT